MTKITIYRTMVQLSKTINELDKYMLFFSNYLIHTTLLPSNNLHLYH